MIRGGPTRDATEDRRRAVWCWLDRHLGRGSYSWLRGWLDPQREYTQRIYVRAVDRLLKPEVRWLDAGCGHRIFCKYALSSEEEQKRVRAVRLAVGCDLDAVALREHRSLHNRLECGLSALPFADESFDLITLNMVAEHLDEPDVVFGEFARVLSPGGSLVIHTPNAASYFVRLVRLGRKLLPKSLAFRLIKYREGRDPEDVFPAFYRANTRRDLSRLLTAAGFSGAHVSLLAEQPLFSFLAPLSAVELLLSRLLLLLGWRDFGACVILGVYQRLPRAVISTGTQETIRGVREPGTESGSDRSVRATGPARAGLPLAREMSESVKSE